MLLCVAVRNRWLTKEIQTDMTFCSNTYLLLPFSLTTFSPPLSLRPLQYLEIKQCSNEIRDFKNGSTQDYCLDESTKDEWILTKSDKNPAICKSKRTFTSLPLCDTNIGTHDRSFLLEIRCLSHLLWLNRKIFLIGAMAFKSLRT